MKTLDIIICVFVIGILCLFVLLPPSHSLTLVVHCSASLHRVGKAILIYQNEHDGALPSSLMLAVESSTDPNLFRSSPTRSVVDGELACNESQVPYVYHPELATNPSHPICWDPKPHSVRKNKFYSSLRSNVLYADGRVKSLKENEFQEVLKPYEGILSKSNDVSSQSKNANKPLQ